MDTPTSVTRVREVPAIAASPSNIAGTIERRIATYLPPGAQRRLKTGQLPSGAFDEAKGEWALICTPQPAQAAKATA